MRKLCFEVSCSRCARVEVQETSPEAAAATVATTTPEDSPDAGDAFYAVIASGKDVTEVRFEELCTPCYKTLHALLGQFGKKIDGLSPDRKERKPKPQVAKKEAPAHTEQVPHNHGSTAGKLSVGAARV
jgi:hypothetical protein